MQKSLRILAVVDLPWDVRLGAIRVFIGLADAWHAAGHTVEKYCMTDAYPAPTSSRFFSVVRQMRFPWKAAAFIRRNRDRFDVIDSLLGTLPFQKKRLRFAGLLIARSVGFYQLYEDFDRIALERSSEPRGKLLGRIFYPLMNKMTFARSEKALRACDLLNLPNDEELRSVRKEIGPEKPALVQPYGLTRERRRDLLQAAVPPAERLSKKKVSFIGMWSSRKGAKDWGKIVRLVRAAAPDTRFLFLGTLVEDRQVLNDLGLPSADFIQLVPEYQPDQLPQLLADSTVGAFPSHAEAFGFGVLEQLAAGVPCVAYDAAGPRAMLKDDLTELLVPVGDVEKFAATLTRVLRGDLAEYEQLCRRSAEAAVRFDWGNIAEQTAESYRSYLSRFKS